MNEMIGSGLMGVVCLPLDQHCRSIGWTRWTYVFVFDLCIDALQIPVYSGAHTVLGAYTVLCVLPIL